MKHIFPYTLCVAFVIAGSSCSIFNKTKTLEVKNVMADTTQEQPVAVAVNNDTEDNVARSSGDYIDKQLAGEWILLSVYNKKIGATDEVPFLNFDNANNRIYGNNGCNVINGSFKISKGKDMAFRDLITTMMSCPSSKFETLIMKALNEVVEYNFSTVSGIINLNLIDKRGAIVLSLKRYNFDFLNGAWTVKEIDGESVTDDNVKLVIDIQELKLHGNSGCNIINGTIGLDPKKNLAIQFQQISSTRKLCPNMKIETALLVALEEVESCKKKNANEVILYDNKKQPILVFKRLDLLK